MAVILKRFELIMLIRNLLSDFASKNLCGQSFFKLTFVEIHLVTIMVIQT